MRRLYLILIVTVAFPFCVFAATIKGKVNDIKTGEALVGATVYLDKTHHSAVTGLDGSYHAQRCPRGFV